MIKLKNATFTSVWDDGYAITTPCKVNIDTKEVFDIDIATINIDNLNILATQYVTIDKTKYKVINADDNIDGTNYWYN